MLTEQKQYVLKDGYVLQTKIFTWDDYMQIDWKIAQQIIDKIAISREAKILYLLNKFCATVEVLDVIVIQQFGTSSMNGTFSKAMASYSRTPEFLVVYQTPKSSLIDGVEG